jgi:hypothetical protein
VVAVLNLDGGGAAAALALALPEAGAEMLRQLQQRWFVWHMQ